MMPNHSDQIILVNGLILADPDSCLVVPHGKTVIKGNMLSEVNSQLEAPPFSSEVIDCSNCLIMPGLVNAHTHAAMSLLRGLADDLPLDKWLNDCIFPSEAKHVGPEFVFLGTSLSAVEMALGGITTFADGYFFMEKAADAAAEVGLRAVIAQGILDVPSPDCPDPAKWNKRIEEFFARFPESPLTRPALFCHSPYLCGPETFRIAKKLAADHGTLLFAHISETRCEVEEIASRFGKTPLEHVHDLGILDRNFVNVHCVHLSDHEKDILADSGAGVVHCPESNMKLASGACPTRDLLKRGTSVAIGTDGPASNNNLDIFEEMRSAALMAKLVTSDPEALDARSVLRMATIQGAQVLGLDHSIGSLKAGKLADLIVIDLDRPHLTPVFDPVSHLVYCARGSDVRDVIVNGRIVVRDGSIITIDYSELASQVRSFAAKIAADLGIRTELK
ncbi:MAG: amidohydrolase [Desulfomonile tiedjei]|uniref:5-methylthioadenosine/S-adenosylhomocysteine deaminase n=1 Tax=Desulfomonile tiedjei TaxID=2358 RepID=A0A9D6V4J2_9BACT|nr:amidohydrolase [Desulfomonile tiedjei]